MDLLYCYVAVSNPLLYPKVADVDVAMDGGEAKAMDALVQECFFETGVGERFADAKAALKRKLAAQATGMVRKRIGKVTRPGS